MKTVSFLTACLMSSAAAFPLLEERQTEDHAWKAPGTADRRSPCPMVNTLANHGYLPRDGLNITMAILVAGLLDGVNLAEPATRLVGAKALEASTTGNPETFNLDDLNRHGGFIEHDGSLSRADTFSGDNHSFNSTIWGQTFSHFTDPIISISTAAKARATRLTAAEAENPQWNFTATDTQNSMIETALYLSVLSNGTLGNGAAATAVREWLDVLFTEERLPIEEGWTRPAGEITGAAILQLVQLIGAASA